MTPEEKEKYHAIIEYHIDGVYLMGRIASINYVNFENLKGEERWEHIIQFIKDSVELDLEIIKQKLIDNEIH